jgi:hypothetical protein
MTETPEIWFLRASDKYTGDLWVRFWVRTMKNGKHLRVQFRVQRWKWQRHASLILNHTIKKWRKPLSSILGPHNSKWRRPSSSILGPHTEKWSIPSSSILVPHDHEPRPVLKNHLVRRQYPLRQTGQKPLEPTIKLISLNARPRPKSISVDWYVTRFDFSVDSHVNGLRPKSIFVGLHVTRFDFSIDCHVNGPSTRDQIWFLHVNWPHPKTFHWTPVDSHVISQKSS